MLINKISALQLSLKFIKSALLVGEEVVVVVVTPTYPGMRPKDIFSFSSTERESKCCRRKEGRREGRHFFSTGMASFSDRGRGQRKDRVARLGVCVRK